MVEYFVILVPGASPDGVRAWLAAAGGRLIQAYGQRALLVELPDGAAARHAWTEGIVGVFDGPVPDDLGELDEMATMGVAAWNLRQSARFRRSRETRIGEGRSWGDEEAEPEG